MPFEAVPAGEGTASVEVADFDNDGLPDFVTANRLDQTVSVFLGNGDGTFRPANTFAAGPRMWRVSTGDVNTDGKTDILTGNKGNNTISVLLGDGGSFGAQRTFPADDGPATVAVADVTRDGRPDLVVGNRKDSKVHVLPGNGEGTFGAPVPFGVQANRYSETVADVNGDGSPDLVTARLREDSVTIRLGTGTGAFDAGRDTDVGAAPASVTVTDLNGDGRPDLVTADSDDDTVSVLLGNGDGTFNNRQSFAVGRSPRAVKAGDVNGDGFPDLVTADYHDATVSVLLGRGDGTFSPRRAVTAGTKPYSLDLGDVNGDGRPDLVVANAGNDTASILLGNGDGSFQTRQDFATGRQPFDVTLGDVNGDGIADVVTANTFDDTLTVLRGIGNGTFQPGQAFAAGSRPYAVSLADVDGDGTPDLVSTDYGDDTISVLLNDGSGAFRPRRIFAGEQLPVDTVVSDVNGDGRADLVTVGNQDREGGVLLGVGDGFFQPATSATDVTLRDRPLLADLDGDRVIDRVVLDRSGNILFRKGLGGVTDAFAPPVVLNPGRPGRDISLVRTSAGLALAAADARFDPALSRDDFIFSVSLYSVGPGGAVSRGTAFSGEALPIRLLAADLNGNGRDDLIAANALDNSVSIAVQTAAGNFGVAVTRDTGVAPSDVAVADLNRDGRPDIVVSNQASGDVSVLLNNPGAAFDEALRFRTGTGLYGLDQNSAIPAIGSRSVPVGLAAGDFTGDGIPDVAAVNRGGHGFTVLPGNGDSGFAAPALARTTSTSDGFTISERPGAIEAGDFDRDGKLDLVVLLEDIGQAWVYRGKGDGTLSRSFTIPVGNEATGLSVVPGATPGLLDLLIGNGYGDVPRLEGAGDGTFQIRGKNVSLSVIADLFGPGKAGVLVGNQQDNRVTVQTQAAGGSQFNTVGTLGVDNSATRLAPGDVQWSVLSRDKTLPDAVVVSTGNNAVFVYRTTSVNGGAPTFAPNPQSYFVGTTPTGVTMTDINGDGVKDMLVTNQGSNDVSVVFGSHDASGGWTGTPGPRLKTGGAGPLAVTLRDLTRDGVPDLGVTNGGSGTITVLPGVGRGFFDDRQPGTLFRLGSTVRETTLAPDSSLGFAVTTDGDLVRFDLGNPAAGSRTVFNKADVLTARALENGRVVAATAGGTILVLAPQGDGLKVISQLKARGGVPELPSSLVVLERADGQLNVLVSSQGSDTVFTYSSAAQTPGATPSGGQPVQAPAATAIITAAAATTGNSSAVVAAVAAGITTMGGSDGGGGTSAAASPAIGGTFSSDGRTGTAATVALVGVQGSTYSTVALLDFGAEGDDQSGDGRGRRPDLATRHSLGELSPLMRLVTGHDEATRQYRDSDKSTSRNAGSQSRDPWWQDLFLGQPSMQAETKPDPARPMAPTPPAKPSAPVNATDGPVVADEKPELLTTASGDRPRWPLLLGALGCVSLGVARIFTSRVPDEADKIDPLLGFPGRGDRR